MSPDPDDKPKTFGEYELVRYLAAGGMADLYLARADRFGDSELVVKRIQTRYLDHTRVVKMFIDEGRIAQALDHPNIVRAVDVGSLGGAYYIAMEYIHGHDLIAICRRAAETGMKLGRGVAVGIVAQVAAGLDYAHSATDDKGRPLLIVHCDISPGNVVVSFRGTAKVVDFGIARAANALREEDGVAGKYSYMAPEQIRGEPVDGRADLFSLGVILWELTVGKRLFRGRPEVVMRKVMEEPIPKPTAIVPGYPSTLEHIVLGLLARDREERYPSAAALRHDLRQYLQFEETGFSKLDTARYLRALFRAPLRGPAGEFDAGTGDDELELDRGMPEASEVEADEELDEEALGRVGIDEPGISGRFVFPADEDPPNAFASRLARELAEGERSDEKSPQARDAALTVGNEAKTKPRESEIDEVPASVMSPGVYVGGVMLLVSFGLLLAYFFVGR